jgi:hypothetical protein
MNEILIKMVIASALQSIKNPDKKAKLRRLMQWAVQSILMAYADDPEFLMDDQVDSKGGAPVPK